MKTKLSLVVVAVGALGLLSGCMSNEGAIGGLAGAGAGAAIGHAVGGEDGWWIGGVAGAALGTAAGEMYHSSTHRKFCPVGGEEYPNEYQICPIHNVQLRWEGAGQPYGSNYGQPYGSNPYGGGSYATPGSGSG